MSNALVYFLKSPGTSHFNSISGIQFARDKC